MIGHKAKNSYEVAIKWLSEEQSLRQSLNGWQGQTLLDQEPVPKSWRHS